jgi:type II secretory pathway component PulJ
MRQRLRLSALLVAAAAPLVATAQENTTPPAAALLQTDAEREAFLLEADIVGTRPAPGGSTGSTRATLRKGEHVHDAHIQTIDEHKSQQSLSSGLDLDFRDSYRNNVAAYRLDRMLELGMVPVTVVRRYEGKAAAFTWWVDDVQMTEKDRRDKQLPAPEVEAWNRQMFVVRIFDQLIYNADRNLGNLLIDKSWGVWMIDHTRAFKIFKVLKNEKSLTEFCERDLFSALRRLDKPTLRARMEGLLSEGQVNAVLARRDKIVRSYEAKIATRGEGVVLYDLPSRLNAKASAR